MVSQKGVDNRQPSKGRPSRDTDIDRLNSIGPIQMSWEDFSVNVVIVVLKCSFQKHFRGGPVSAHSSIYCKEMFCLGAAGKNEIFFTMFNIWIAAELRSDGGG